MPAGDASITLCRLRSVSSRHNFTAKLAGQSSLVSECSIYFALNWTELVKADDRNEGVSTYAHGKIHFHYRLSMLSHNCSPVESGNYRKETMGSEWSSAADSRKCLSTAIQCLRSAQSFAWLNNITGRELPPSPWSLEIFMNAGWEICFFRGRAVCVAREPSRAATYVYFIGNRSIQMLQSELRLLL